MSKTYGGDKEPKKIIEISKDGKTATVTSVKVVEVERKVDKYNFVKKEKTEYVFKEEEKPEYTFIPKTKTDWKFKEETKVIEKIELNLHSLRIQIEEAVKGIIKDMKIGDYIKGIIKEQLEDVRVPNLIPFDFEYADLKPKPTEFIVLNNKPVDFPVLKPFDQPLPELKPIPKHYPDYKKREEIITVPRIDWLVTAADREYIKTVVIAAVKELKDKNGN